MKISPNRFLTASLESEPWGAGVTRILAAAIQSVDPSEALYRCVQRQGDLLTIRSAAGDSPARTYDLRDFKHIYVVGAGKAGAPMTQAIAQILRNRLSGGLVIVKDGYTSGAKTQSSSGKIEIVQASHPIPDERGLQATNRILALLEAADQDDLIICLISGGGSALLTAPEAGISLQDLQALTKQLLASGASIHEINALRKHLDQVKGGGLAQAGNPAHMLSLILSDVVGNSLDVIASGPTVADNSSFQECHDILERYKLLDKIPVNVLKRIRQGVSGQQPETPKPGEAFFANVHNAIIGSNHVAAQAALEKAAQEGYNVMLLTTYLQGEARQVGRLLVAIARQVAESNQPIPRPACILAGGETTVTLHGDGLGGRNQELALGAVVELAGLQDIALVSLATDGGDGPTDAAGAVVTGQTLSRAEGIGLVPAKFLARNDSYHFFQPLGDLLKPGPTLTNVNDLVFLFAL